MQSPLYIVIYEARTVLGTHCFKAVDKTFDQWIDADNAANAKAAEVRRRAWVIETGRPQLVELVK